MTRAYVEVVKSIKSVVDKLNIVKGAVTLNN